MRFALGDHEGKAGYLHQALVAAGHTASEGLADADVLLLDCDWRWAHPRPEMIGAAVEAGAKVVLYPHGGLSTVFVYDGLTEPDPRVDMRLEHGPGNGQVAEMLGLELRQEAVGWLYSPTREFIACPEPRKVLFAPQHPNMATVNGPNGNDPGPALNQQVYKQLLRLRYDVTVSVVGPLWRNGVWPHPKTTLTSNHGMEFSTSYQQILKHDVVVAAGTFLAAAVALGKPAVGIGGHDCADYVDGAYKRSENAESYEETLRYPLDAADDHLENLIGTACLGSAAVDAWRGLFVGNDGTKAAIEVLERLCPSSSRNATIAGATARSGANA